jgi:hypothetical protein
MFNILTAVSSKCVMVEQRRVEKADQAAHRRIVDAALLAESTA